MQVKSIPCIQPSNLLAQTNRESFQRFMDSILQKAGKLRALNKNLLENFDVSDDSVAQCRPHLSFLVISRNQIWKLTTSHFWIIRTCPYKRQGVWKTSRRRFTTLTRNMMSATKFLARGIWMVSEKSYSTEIYIPISTRLEKSNQNLIAILSILWVYPDCPLPRFWEKAETKMRTATVVS